MFLISIGPYFGGPNVRLYGNHIFGNLWPITDTYVHNYFVKPNTEILTVFVPT
jgi:hypothetical protein